MQLQLAIRNVLVRVFWLPTHLILDVMSISTDVTNKYTFCYMKLFPVIHAHVQFRVPPIDYILVTSHIDLQCTQHPI